MNKNNESNLASYRREIKEKNFILITKAISHLKSIGANINQSSVSKVTYLIADPLIGESGLTAAAISKNPIYKTLITSEKLQMNHQQVTKDRYKTTLNEAEASLEIFRLKSEISQYKRDMKILQHHLKNIKYEDIKNDSASNIDENIELRDALTTIIEVLFERKLISFDTEFNLQLALYGNKLLSNKLVSKLGILKNAK